MPNPPPAAGNLTTPQALKALVDPSSTQTAGQIVKSTRIYQKSDMDKKLVGQRLVPVRSALVRQKTHGAKDLAGLKTRAKALEGTAKSGLAKELAQAKKAAQPLKQLETKDKAALKKLAQNDKAALSKAMAPTKSVLVRQKAHAEKNLLAYKNQLKGLEAMAKSKAKSDVAGVKKAAKPFEQQSLKDLAAAKKQAQVKKQAALKAAAPLKSVLVRQKQLGSKDLSAVKGRVGKDVTALKGQLGAAKKAAGQSEAGQLTAKGAKKAKLFGKKAAQTPLGRLLGL